MSKREVLFSTENARGIVKVPLGGKPEGRYATLYKEDYQSLAKLGVRFDNWFVNGPHLVMFRSPGGYMLSVARMILECDRGQRVSYKDGNGLNLRRDNLRMVTGKGYHCDIDRFMRSLEARERLVL